MENAKSVIDIEVNDDQFKKFHELFTKYQEQLGEMPGAWSETGEKIKDATDNIDKQAEAQASADKDHLTAIRDFSAALMAQNQLHHEAIMAENKQNRERSEALKKQAQEEKQINDLHKARVKTVKDFAGTLGGMIGSTATIGLNIAKWGIGLGVGLLGGGFFGMERLGASATNDRMRAHGLGVSAGELRAWQTDVGNYIDPSSLLGTASNAYADPSQRALLQRAGVSADTIRSGNTSQISEQALRGLIEFYNRNQGPNATQSWAARGFDQLLSFGDIRRIASVPASEQARMFSNLRRDTTGLNNSDTNLSAWQDFYTSLQRSGQLLKTTFLDGLVGLSGPIKELSGSLINLVREFMQGGGFKDVIDIVKTGITDLSDSMRDGSFRKAVHEISDAFKELYDSGNLVNTLHMIESGLAALAKILGIFAPSSSEAGKEDQQRRDHWKSGAALGGTIGAGAGMIVPGIGPILGGALGVGLGSASGAIYDIGLDFSSYLDSIRQAESSGNNTAVSIRGARGAYQLMPATAAQYGVSDPFDPTQSRAGAGRYINDLRRMFRGDMVKVTAAYNAGQGRVGEAVSQYGDDWLSHMPKETKAYVGRVARNYEATGNVNINISNNTGGAATVTAAQAFR